MTDIERDHEFDSDDERPVDLDGPVPANGADDDVPDDFDVHEDPEAPEADVLDQHREVLLEDDVDDVTG